MKKILIILACIASLSPLSARADKLSPEEAWAFLYQFPLQYTNGRIAQSAPYQIATGDAPVIAVGAWKLVLMSESGEVLHQYFFDPKAIPPEGLIVPMEDRGAQARIVDGVGKNVLSIDVRGSRVCDDSGTCEADAGETSLNCATDCGAVASDVADTSLQSATITDQMSGAEILGQALLRLSAGVAGLMLLAGIASMLDNRRRL